MNLFLINCILFSVWSIFFLWFIISSLKNAGKISSQKTSKKKIIMTGCPDEMEDIYRNR